MTPGTGPTRRPPTTTDLQESFIASRPRPIRTRRAAAQIGAQLAASRERQQLSVDQLAERASISRGTLRRVESGDPAVGLATFLTVVKALGQLDAVMDALEPEAD